MKYGYISQKPSRAMEVGKRIFDVRMEGSIIFNDLDIFKEAGQTEQKAVTKSTNIVVSDGKLTIQFERVQQNPKICAIEVRPASSGSPSGSSIYINAGGPTYTDRDGREWIADTPYVNTGNKFLSPATITGTRDPVIYKTERYDSPSGPEMVYSIPVPSPGQYVVALHFAEVYSETQQIGERVFDVKIEGLPVFNSVDIYREAGQGNKAYLKITTVTANDRVLSIEFIHRKENPKICAIEVHPAENSQVSSGSPPESD